MTDYNHHYLGSGYGISSEDLGKLEPELQKQVMKSWFYENYEDPADRTPYESKEGGYIWIWGGPYDAREVLDAEFSDFVSDEVLNAVVEELDNHCVEWGPKEKDSDYDIYFVEDIAEITESYQNYLSAAHSIKQLLEMKIVQPHTDYFYRILFANVITIMETYLSDTLIQMVLSNEKLLRRFVEKTKSFKKDKIAIDKIYVELSRMDERVKKYLADISWHKLSWVKPIYKVVLNVDIEISKNGLMKAVFDRHDIIHRNGKTKKGKELKIGKQDVYRLLETVDDIVQNIENKIDEINEFGIHKSDEFDNIF